MPVIRHHAIRRDAETGLGMSLCKNCFKRGVVRRLLEERQSSHATIQDGIGKVSSGEPWPARHGGSPTEYVVLLSKNDSRPLLSPELLMTSCMNDLRFAPSFQDFVRKQRGNQRPCLRQQWLDLIGFQAGPSQGGITLSQVKGRDPLTEATKRLDGPIMGGDFIE